MRSCEGLFWQFGHSVGHSQPQRIPGGLAYAQNILHCRVRCFAPEMPPDTLPLVANFPMTDSGKEPRGANLSSPKISHHVEC